MGKGLREINVHAQQNAKTRQDRKSGKTNENMERRHRTAPRAACVSPIELSAEPLAMAARDSAGIIFNPLSCIGWGSS